MTTGARLAAVVAALAAADAPHQALLIGGPVALRLDATTPEPLAALTALLAPYLQPGTQDPRPETAAAKPEQIRLHTHHAALPHLRELADRPHLTAGGIQLVRASAGAADRRRHVFLLWDQATPGSSHLVLDRPGPATDHVALRLIRGIAARALITAGWVPLHAAAATTRAGLLVLAGPSGTGKTTTLLHLLGLAQALVAGDKTYLTTGKDGVRARALPTSLALRPDTAATFPAAARTDSTHIDNHPDRCGADQRLLLPPRGVARAFGVALHPTGPVSAIVPLGLAPPGRPSTWRQAAPTCALDAVTDAYLTDWFIDEPHEHARLAASAVAIRAAHHLALDRITAAVPVIELRAGTAMPQALRAILAELA